MLFVTSNLIPLQVLIVMVFLLSSCGPRQVARSDISVIGGTPTQAPPYFAALHTSGEDEPFCGGSLIAPNVVITAAHCGSRLKGDLAVWLGMSTLDAKPTPIAVHAIIRHPRYHNRKYQHDLALLFLASNSSLSPIALAPEDMKPDRLRIYGYGNISPSGHLYPTEIQTANVTEIGRGHCKTLGGPYGSVIGEQICAGDLQEGATDSCDGDSGGPLIAEGNTHQLYGLVSWGTACGQAQRPGVYTRLAPYQDWVQTEINRITSGEMPLEDFMGALFYAPLRYKDQNGSEKQFTASHQHWKKSSSTVRSPPLMQWQRTWQNQTIHLELHSKGPQRYEWKVYVRGEWYVAAANFSS